MNAQIKTTKAMEQLNTLGWVKTFNHAIKGQYYFTPRGTVVFNAMSDFLKCWVKKELASLEIRTPTIYDWNHPSIQAESSQFAERTFQCEVDDKIGVLNPGGDYGVMSFLSQSILHEAHLPIALFELTSSFRKGRSRELSGLLKARSFTLLDHHTFVADADQAWNAYADIMLAQAKLGNYFNFDWGLTLQIAKEFLISHQHKIAELEDKVGKPIQIDPLENKKNYWEMQHIFTDNQDQISFSDGQFDLNNGVNYQIEYFSANGKDKKHAIVCHGSFDSVERWIFKLVNHAIPHGGYTLPLWLNPIHLRIIPTHEKLVSFANQIKELAAKKGIRADIDQRNKSLTAKLEYAATEWIPYRVIVTNQFESIENSPITYQRLNGEEQTVHIHALLNEIFNELTIFDHPNFTDLQSVFSKPSIR